MAEKKDDDIRDMKTAVQMARTNDWDGAHKIVQKLSSPMACWLHAALHKIEGDETNARYWYARTDKNYGDYSDPSHELDEIQRALEGNQTRG